MQTITDNNTLRASSGMYDFAHEYRITEQGDVQHRFVTEDGTERSDGSSEWKFATSVQINTMLRDCRAEIEQICRAAGVDVNNIKKPIEYSAPKRVRKGGGNPNEGPSRIG